MWPADVPPSYAAKFGSRTSVCPYVEFPCLTFAHGQLRLDAATLALRRPGLMQHLMRCGGQGRATCSIDRLGGGEKQETPWRVLAHLRAPCARGHL